MGSFQRHREEGQRVQPGSLLTRRARLAFCAAQLALARPEAAAASSSQRPLSTQRALAKGGRSASVQCAGRGEGSQAERRQTHSAAAAAASAAAEQGQACASVLLTCLQVCAFVPSERPTLLVGGSFSNSPSFALVSFGRAGQAGACVRQPAGLFCFCYQRARAAGSMSLLGRRAAAAAAAAVVVFLVVLLCVAEFWFALGSTGLRARRSQSESARTLDSSCGERSGQLDSLCLFKSGSLATSFGRWVCSFLL